MTPTLGKLSFCSRNSARWQNSRIHHCPCSVEETKRASRSTAQDFREESSPEAKPRWLGQNTHCMSCLWSGNYTDTKDSSHGADVVARLLRWKHVTVLVTGLPYPRFRNRSNSKPMGWRGGKQRMWRGIAYPATEEILNFQRRISSLEGWKKLRWQKEGRTNVNTDVLWIYVSLLLKGDKLYLK